MAVTILGGNLGDVLQEEEHCRNAEAPSLEYAALVQNMISIQLSNCDLCGDTGERAQGFDRSDWPSGLLVQADSKLTLPLLKPLILRTLDYADASSLVLWPPDGAAE